MDVPLFRGRLDAEKVGALAEVGLLAPADVDVAYVCGPGDMLDAVTASLERLGVPGDRVRTERFTAAGAPRPPAAAEAPAPRAEGVQVEVTLDGMTRAFALAPGESVLDAGARAGIELPWSCAGGMCSTCRCKLLAGEADMKVNYALEPWELERGYILACQAVPKSDRLALDFDEQ
jgi:ring-1,2-phenylacetyl-CoA epoxidase subunit PaaE